MVCDMEEGINGEEEEEEINRRRERGRESMEEARESVVRQWKKNRRFAFVCIFAYRCLCFGICLIVFILFFIII
jgi:t-SNARE complex subunit (syntaxin)